MRPGPAGDAARARARVDARARWAGPLMLGAAVLDLLGLGALRNQFPAVPNLAWLAVLIGLLIAGGARAGRALAGGALADGALSIGADRTLRDQRIGRVTVLLGAGAFVVGVLSIREAAKAWTSDARVVGALALCASLAALPFGVAVLRRVVPVVRARAATAREACFATANPSAAPRATDNRPPPAP